MSTTNRDEVERAARALLAAIEAEQEWGTTCDPDNFGCACDGGPVSDPMADEDRPCSACLAKATKARAMALRFAMSRPAPATEAKCPRCHGAGFWCDYSNPESLTSIAVKCDDDFHTTPRAGASEGEVVDVPAVELRHLSNMVENPSRVWDVDRVRDTIQRWCARPTPPPAASDPVRSMLDDLREAERFAASAAKVCDEAKAFAREKSVENESLRAALAAALAAARAERATQGKGE